MPFVDNEIKMLMVLWFIFACIANNYPEDNCTQIFKSEDKVSEKRKSTMKRIVLKIINPCRGSQPVDWSSG